MSISFEDEYSGVGGQYVVDANTGKRRQVQAPTAIAVASATQPTLEAEEAELEATRAELARIEGSH